MPAHIEHAARIAGEADAPNAQFHATDFAAARLLPLPRFDYIVAHGVYSWVDRPVRAAPVHRRSPEIGRPRLRQLQRAAGLDRRPAVSASGARAGGGFAG